MYSRHLFSYGGFVAINVHGKQTVDKPFYVYKPCYVCNRCLFTRSLETVDTSSRRIFRFVSRSRGLFMMDYASLVRNRPITVSKKEQNTYKTKITTASMFLTEVSFA